MNQRVIDLYEQAAEFAYKICKNEGRPGGPTDHIWNTLSTGKFAELMVEECAKICADTAVAEPPNDLFEGYNMGVNKAAENIREHFGIEDV